MAGPTRALVAEGGTDVASVALFDPAALDPTFDERFRRGVDVAELLEEQCARGAAFVTETGADGSFLLHAYVDDEPPPELRGALRDPIVVDPFLVPSGRLVFGGAEAMHRTADEFVRRYPTMVTTLRLPAGTYRLTVYRTEFPRDEAAVLESMLTDDERRTERIRWLTIPVIVAGVAVALGSAFFRSAASAVLGLGIALVASSARSRANRSPSAGSVDDKRRALAMSRPSIVALLSRSTSEVGLD